MRQRELLARIKELEGQIATGPVVIEQDTTAIEHDAEARGYDKAVRECSALLEPILDGIGDLNSNIGAMARDTAALREWTAAQCRPSARR